MHVKKFKPEDLQHIKSWLGARDLPASYADDIPSIGFSVFDEDQMIAAGFIRHCEGNHGLIDGLITNPNVPGDIRDSALNLLLSHIVRVGTQMHLKSLIGHSKDKNTVLRAGRHGFQEMPHVLLSLNLSKVG